MIHVIHLFFTAFEPQYANPGGIQKASLTSPEAQILNTATIIGLQNGLMSMIDVGLNDCYGGLGLRSVCKFLHLNNDLQLGGEYIKLTFCPFTQTNLANCGKFRDTYSPEVYSNGALAFNPTDQSTASAVVDELALLLTGGRLSTNSRAAIEAAYSSTLSSVGADKALRMAQKLIIATPEFHSSGTFKPLEASRPEPTLPPESDNGYKAVVYVNLDGGLDSFNTLVPHSSCRKGILFSFFLSFFSIYSSKNVIPS